VCPDGAPGRTTTEAAGVGANVYSYVGFTFPAGFIPSGFGTPSSVLLNVYLQSGSPITSMSGMNVYAVRPNQRCQRQ